MLALLSQAAIIALLVSDVALASLVFVVHARPESTLGWFATLSGQRGAWLEGRLDEAEERRLLDLAERSGWPLLGLLFAWSFLCGALLVWSRF